MSENRNQVGPAVPGWTPRPRPPRTAMAGSHCTVRPLEVARDATDLFKAYQEAPDGSDWTYLPVDRFERLDGLVAHLERAAASADPFHHAIIDAATGRAIGTAAYLRIDPANGVIEVGHITYSPRLKRTRAATEAMYLMMRRVFDELAYRRYEWKCDSLNAPSRAAAERYGFKFEGLFRQAVVYKGRSRDTAWFSIVDREWPPIRDAFQAWLDPGNFDAGGRQLRSLRAIREAAGGSG